MDRKFLIPKNFVVYIVVIIYNLLFFEFLRLGFLIKNFNYYKGIDNGKILFSFLQGARFDISAIVVSICWFFLIFHLPGKWKENSIVKKIVYFFVFVVIDLMYITMFIDIFYYEFAARRVSAIEVLSVSTHIKAMALLILTKYWWGILLFITFFGIFNFILWYIINKLDLKKENLNFVTETIYFFVFVIFSTILIRGGLQNRPITPAVAFNDGSVVLGHLRLNGWYTVLNYLWESKVYKDDKEYIKYEEAVEILRKLIKTDDEKFVEDRYPLLRQTYYKTPTKKLNVVIFIVESLHPDYLSYMPFLSSLKKEGLYFDNFYSCATRTWPAVSAILFSIPVVYNKGITDEPFSQNVYRSIAHILKDEGYQTIFLHGGEGYFFRFNYFTKYIGGFEKTIFKEDFDLYKIKVDKSWGVHDEYVFLKANEEFKNLNQPFLGVVLSLSSHEPYDLPSEFKIAKSTFPYAEYLNSLRYVDYSLEQFFKVAKKEKYFDNTIFIIVSDHQQPIFPKNPLDAFHIFCLFYSPKHIKPQVCSVLGSQLDILPSIIDFLKINTLHSSFGKSLFVSKENRFVYMNGGEVKYWVKDSYILVHNIQQVLGLYNYFDDPGFKSSINDTKLKQELETQFFSFYQVAREVLKQNLIYHNKFNVGHGF
jgi:phosphoglycerol transferase MdoB-like AlkP superfamily enzyme